MALIQCPECGKMVSEMAELCPGCGCPTAAFSEIRFKNEETKKMEEEQRILDEEQQRRDEIIKGKENELKTLVKNTVSKFLDWGDLQNTNNCISKDIQNKIDFGFPVYIKGFRKWAFSSVG